MPVTGPAYGVVTRLPVHQRLAAPGASLLAGLAALALLAVRDPHRSGSYGHCPFLELTGHPCPLCGGLRAFSDLIHGDLAGALRSNALAVLLVLGGGVGWVIWAGRRARGSGSERPPLTSDPRLGQPIAVAVVGFGVLRWVLP